MSLKLHAVHLSCCLVTRNRANDVRSPHKRADSSAHLCAKRTTFPVARKQR